MNPFDAHAAIRDAALAKLAKARPQAVALTLGPGDAPGAASPDALVVAPGGAPPETWLGRGWRPAFVEDAAASIDALDAAGYECFRAGDALLALRRADFHAGDIALYKLLRDQSLAVVALSNMLAGVKL